MFFPPLPRFRAYTKLSDYFCTFRDFLSGQWRKGDDVARLEAEFLQRFGGEHALAVNQARIGIYLAVKAVIRPGRDKIIMSPYVIFDVVNMVVAAGGRPVFADTVRETCNIDIADMERLIDDQTAAVMVTHLHGLMCDVEQAVEIAARRGVLVIEDAAQSLGAHRGGRFSGTFGDIGIFSFGLAKNVNCFYGGMVVARDRGLRDRMAAEMAGFSAESLKRLAKRVIYGVATDLSTYPPLFRILTYWLFRVGYLKDIEFLNKRVRVEDNPVLRRQLPDAYRQKMSPAQARLVRPQLAKVEENQQARIRRAALYHDGLRDIPAILLPPLRRDGSHAYLIFPIQVDDRYDLVRHLMTEGRDCTVQHLKNCADLECFAEFARDCPNTRATASQVVVLPTYPRYSEHEVGKMIAAIRSYFGK